MTKKIKVAIIGTRGIPNHYGGFEQLAEYLSVLLTEQGYDVTVYNSSLHPFKGKEYQGVKIVHCNDPENKWGTAGQFIYDFNCIRHARRQEYDAILQLGYTSSSIWSFMFPKYANVVTNMDGMEWKRSKYGRWTKRFLKRAEKWAVKYSDVLVADSKGIQNYIQRTYGKSAVYIPYGADLMNTIDQRVLEQFRLSAFSYYLLIARMEPENNIEMIIKGYKLSNSSLPLLIIGSTKTKYGTYLKKSYESGSIRFLESIYDIQVLDQLRHFASIYFHGHSVGGTNPSLLEAMASGAYICAHNNEFNAGVLGEDALYFSSENELVAILNNTSTGVKREEVTRANIEKIKTIFTWKNIADAYSKVLQPK